MPVSSSSAVSVRPGTCITQRVTVDRRRDESALTRLRGPGWVEVTGILNRVVAQDPVPPRGTDPARAAGTSGIEQHDVDTERLLPLYRVRPTAGRTARIRERYRRAELHDLTGRLDEVRRAGPAGDAGVHARTGDHVPRGVGRCEQGGREHDDDRQGRSGHEPGQSRGSRMSGSRRGSCVKSNAPESGSARRHDRSSASIRQLLDEAEHGGELVDGGVDRAAVGIVTGARPRRDDQGRGAGPRPMMSYCGGGT